MPIFLRTPSCLCRAAGTQTVSPEVARPDSSTLTHINLCTAFPCTCPLPSLYLDISEGQEAVGDDIIGGDQAGLPALGQAQRTLSPLAALQLHQQRLHLAPQVLLLLLQAPAHAPVFATCSLAWRHPTAGSSTSKQW